MAAGDLATRTGVGGGWRRWLHLARTSPMRRNAIEFTTLSGVERVVALAQTVLISRAIGLTEYGVYGLLFGTIGFVASVVGLQMGLTATVFISRYRVADKAKAAQVISIVGTFAWGAAVLVMLVALPFAQPLSVFLVKSDAYASAVLVGIVYIAATVLSGVQDGIAQGFERFVALARVKIGVSALVLLAIYPVATTFGLTGVMVAIVAGLIAKCLLLQRTIGQSRREAGIPFFGSGVTARALIVDFAFPSMAKGLLVGFVTWLGLFLLSQLEGGFDHVAVVTAGLQWRGPVQLLSASVGSVTVPAFSRMSASGDASGSRGLLRRLTAANLVISSTAALVMVAGSGMIMAMYGEGFEHGRLAFCLIGLSAVPAVVATAYMQELVGSARMWRLLWLHGPYMVVLLAGFVVLVPRYESTGYAVSLLVSSLVLLGHAVMADRQSPRSGGAAAPRW